MPSSSNLHSLGGSATGRRHRASAATPRNDTPLSSIRFLLQMAQNFEEQGNTPESVKSAESALLLRRSHEPEIARAIALEEPGSLDLPLSISEQARDLVLRCNSYAVTEFTERRYDSATFFLNKGLFLTDNGMEKTAADISRTVRNMMATFGGLTEAEALALGSTCFAKDDAERLRLRAATYNNLGCMERHRGQLEQALGYLRRAIQFEARLDPSGTTSASTYLNLCTVLNGLQRHGEAVAAAERASVSLQQILLEQTEPAMTTRFAMMLAVGQYNLGVSLEHRGKKGDLQAAQRAYQQSLDTSRRYLIGSDCSTVDAALEAIKRMKDPQQQPGHATVSHGSSWDANGAPVERPGPSVGPTAPAVAAQFGGRMMSTEPPQSSQQRPHGVFSATYGGTAAHERQRLAGPQQQRGSDGGWMAATVQYSAAADGSVAAMEVGEGQRHGPLAGGQPAAPPQDSTAPPVALNPHLFTSKRGGSSSGGGNDNFLLRPARIGPGPAPPALTPLPQQHHQLQLPSSLIPRPPSSTALFSAPTPGWPTRGASGSGVIPVLGPTASVGGGGGGGRLSFDAAVLQQPSLTFSSSSPLNASQRGALPLMPDLPDSKRKSISGASLPPLGASPSNPFGRRTFGNVARSNSSVSGAHQSVSAHHNNSSSSIRVSSSVAGASSGGGGRPYLNNTGSVKQQRERERERSKSMDKSKRLQEKIKKEEQRRQMRAVAAADAQLADTLYDQMVARMEDGELRRCRGAAVRIQALWRGVAARTLVLAMIAASVRIQRVTRRFLVKAREERRLEAEARAVAEAERQRRELAACRTLQARARQFLRRTQIQREYIARQRRRFFAARTIQRAYRGFCRRRAEHIAAQAEANRREDEQRQFRRRVAARRIQGAFRSYTARRAELRQLEEQHRRSRSATTIQALVRGVLTRAWFRYYRTYRRDQEVRSAASQRRLVRIQAAARAVLSGEYCRQRQRELVLRMREQKLSKAATTIQCMWRCHVARIRYERLLADRQRAQRAATRLIGWLQSRVLRRRFLAHRAEQRTLRCIVRVQRWWRECRQRAKEKEFADYHAELLRQQRLQRLRQESVLVIQACCYARESDRLVASARGTFLRNEHCTQLWQRMGRGHQGRLHMAHVVVLAHQVRQREVQRMREVASALVLQRAWRNAAAKGKVEQMRRDNYAATVIARSYRMYRARRERHALRAARRGRGEDRAARVIQRAWRMVLHQRKAEEMNAYYRAQHRRGVEKLRRVQACVQIQSIWRGYVTRREYAAQRAVMDELGVYARRIQRAWRTLCFRRQMRAEVSVRAVERNYHAHAATRIQCFWRKIAAAERVARLRETTHRRRAAALCIQCWWRVMLAQRCREWMRQQRAEEEAAMVLYALKWEKATTVVSAFLQARACQIENTERLRAQLLSELALEDRVRFLLRHKAATKIQAHYRGYYERVYVRGLRREKAEEERLQQQHALERERAATRIQCAYRKHMAVLQVRHRRTAKREEIMRSYEERLASASPSEIVKELFWTHAATELRNTARIRLERKAQRDAAATHIQRNYRCYAARVHVGKLSALSKKHAAATLIQHRWKRYRALRAGSAVARQERAALVLQKHVRGWMVRREWAPWRDSVEEERRLLVTAEDVLDHAATVIQSFWRRVVAQRRANELRVLREEDKSARACEEAAVIIQEAFRTSRRYLHSHHNGGDSIAVSSAGRATMK